MQAEEKWLWLFEWFEMTGPRANATRTARDSSQRASCFGPGPGGRSSIWALAPAAEKVVARDGVEPPAQGFSVPRSTA